MKGVAFSSIVGMVIAGVLLSGCTNLFCGQKFCQGAVIEDTKGFNFIVLGYFPSNDSYSIILVHRDFGGWECIDCEPWIWPRTEVDKMVYLDRVDM
jgi:hypothetical protein